MATEASYVYILSGQKFIKKAKNGQFGRVFENLKLAVKQCFQICHFSYDKNCWKMPKFKCDLLGYFETVLPALMGQKLVENAKSGKIQMRHFWVIFKHCEGV